MDTSLIRKKQVYLVSRDVMRKRSQAVFPISPPTPTSPLAVLRLRKSLFLPFPAIRVPITIFFTSPSFMFPFPVT